MRPIQMRPVRLALLAALLALPACATVEGAGRDISKAGELVSEGAREVRAF
jgi:predicted small secreted protein